MPSLMSLPSWERGLKCQPINHEHTGHGVAPLVGAWIEIRIRYTTLLAQLVAPLVGAWIEIVHVHASIPGFSGRSPRGSVD